MNHNTTCKTCTHFDTAHGMCLAQVTQTALGPVFAIRTNDSPACWSNYNKRYLPGEISLLFEENRINSVSRG